MDRSGIFFRSPTGILALLAVPWFLAQTGDDFISQKQRLAELTPEIKAELQRKRDEFERLPEDEQQRIREFHQLFSQLSEARQSHLKNVLRDYHEWLKELTPKERAVLRGMTIDDRIKEIRRIRDEQQRQDFGIAGETKLPDEDLTPFTKWMSDLRTTKQALIEKVTQMRGDRSSERQIYAVLRLPPEEFRKLISEEDLQQLSATLSKTGAAILNKSETFERKTELIQRWSQAAIVSTFRRKISEENLQKFYDNALTGEERDRFDELSPTQWRRDLTALYRRTQWYFWTRVSNQELDAFFKEELSEEKQAEIDSYSDADRKWQLFLEYRRDAKQKGIDFPSHRGGRRAPSEPRRRRPTGPPPGFPVPERR